MSDVSPGDVRVMSRVRSWRSRVLLNVVLVVVVVAAISVFVDPDRLVALVTAADARLLLLGAAVHAVSWGVRTVRFRLLLSNLSHPLSYRFLLPVVLTTQIGNVFLPARSGDAIRAYVLNNRRSVPYVDGFAAVTVERVADLAAVGCLGGVAAVLFVASGTVTPTVPSPPAEWPTVAVGVGGAVVVLAVVAWGVTRRRTDAASLRSRIVGVVRQYLNRLAKSLAGPRQVTIVSAVSLCIWLLDAATALAVLSAFDIVGPTLSAVTVAVGAVSTGAVGKIVPLSPGGIGAYEGVFAAVVTTVTTAETDVALTAGLVDHGIKNAVAVTAGLLALLGFDLSVADALREDRP